MGADGKPPGIQTFCHGFWLIRLTFCRFWRFLFLGDLIIFIIFIDLLTIFSFGSHPEAVLQQRLVAKSSAEHSLEDHQTTAGSQLGGLGEAEGQRPICTNHPTEMTEFWDGDRY